ncbi:acetolactate decarboxylase [Cerasicoccus arenae]|uniref:Alpha-acetolactate decarboxylase n=1 Tax=Cerasicoccus arenae TaxID=424488 RepID=A0A8J3GCR3_9BACT|nr:acetolactate decarboxylase [Cerasicoccus arenae]MBK1857709.1 acetolactate decarboxylase [Cerasicoccus arenae]GHB91233.1 alpha-acetolactate decarboxylase [Cerasicoccus arenae]
MRCIGLTLIGLTLSSLLLAKGTLAQFSVIDALLAGIYDGPTNIGELKAAGDTGLGTFNALDGELVMLDGVVYQIAHEGEVHVMPDDAHTPFAVVCDFMPEMVFPLWPVDSFHAFEGRWTTLSAATDADYLYPPDPLSENQFYAVKLEGKFTTIKARSVPRQSPPYRPLGEVVADQNIFNFAEIEGTMVGFYCPPYTRGVNVPGWHFHFISQDRQFGGHVLDFSSTGLPGVTVAWQMLDKLSLRLPGDAVFANVDLTPDRQEDLDKVERLRTED